MAAQYPAQPSNVQVLGQPVPDISSLTSGSEDFLSCSHTQCSRNIWFGLFNALMALLKTSVIKRGYWDQ